MGSYNSGQRRRDSIRQRAFRNARVARSNTRPRAARSSQEPTWGRPRRTFGLAKAQVRSFEEVAPRWAPTKAGMYMRFNPVARASQRASCPRQHRAPRSTLFAPGGDRDALTDLRLWQARSVEEVAPRWAPTTAGSVVAIRFGSVLFAMRGLPAATPGPAQRALRRSPPGGDRDSFAGLRTGTPEALRKSPSGGLLQKPACT